MNWYQNIEERRSLVIGGMILICVVLLIVTAGRLPISFDSYWHLQTGLDWIRNGLNPWIDHYSFTMSGQPIAGQPVIFQAFLALLVDTFGLESGYQIYKLLCFFSAFSLLVWFMKSLRTPAFVYLVILPLFVLLIQLRSTVRPELISYSFIILAVILYHRSQAIVSLKNLLPMCVLMLLWTNYHSSILGYIIFFGFFVDAAVLQIKNRASIKTWGTWLAWGLVILGVGFLRKGSGHPALGIFFFEPAWKTYIQEYQSSILYTNIAAIYVLIFLSALTFYLSAKNMKMGYLLVTGILIFHAFNMARLVTPNGIIILCFLVSLLNEAGTSKSLRASRFANNWLAALAILVLSGISLYSSTTFARWILQENKASSIIRPELLVEYMKTNQVSGHIFNEMGIGGYLIYALTPNSKVYIDGRTNILYPVELYENFLESKYSPKILRSEMEKFDINLAILENDPRSYSVASETGLLELDYIDHKYSLFTHTNATYKVLGQLVANPACWDTKNLNQLNSEITRAKNEFSTDLPMWSVINLIHSLANGSDEIAMIKGANDAGISDPFELRILAYRSLFLGLPQISLDLLEKLPQWDHREFLAAAIANIQLEQWEKAELSINALLKSELTAYSKKIENWPYVTWTDIVLQYRILETIKKNGGLQHVSSQHVDGLRDTIESMGESTNSLALELSLLCTF